jgi:hypothetical protein
MVFGEFDLRRLFRKRTFGHYRHVVYTSEPNLPSDYSHIAVP